MLLPMLKLIRSSLCMSHLTSGWNEFKKVPYFSPKYFHSQLEPSSKEMTNMLTSCMYLRSRRKNKWE